jgi:RNA polymerase sigma-70 factor (ECF subfamily)
MEEQEAIARLKQGDITGLEALVKTYQTQAMRTAYLITRDRATAEDIVQETFLRVYERIGQFESGRPFGPWFLRCVANQALKTATRGRRCLPLDDDESPLRDIPAADPDLLHLVEHAETREAIWAALGQLSPEQRAVIVLHYYLDLSETEMTAALTCPRGTVKWRLHAARERLRILLQSFWLARFHEVSKK